MPAQAARIQLPSIATYGNYSSDNYGAHALRVNLGVLTVWFSYTTPIAFQVEGHARVVRENAWSTTTGKHLNRIDGGSRQDKKSRVSSERFAELWSEQVEPLLVRS